MTPKPGRSDSAGYEAPTGATTTPSTTPGRKAALVATGGDAPGGRNEGGGAEDDGGGSLESQSWKSHGAVQGFGGFLAGLAVGVVPGAGPTSNDLIQQGVLARGTREARIGKAVGEIVGGIVLTIAGVGGKAAGIVASATGVGALLGVPAVAVAAVAVVGGAGNVASGIRGLSEALSTGGMQVGRAPEVLGCQAKLCEPLERSSAEPSLPSGSVRPPSTARSTIQRTSG
ncbi:MAG TPA: hypothetical protein VL025_11950 [Thermoanaerobaculia bacterium]|nr:hypothetical protein [Thermoanaerobaculia bacterium]